jgi:hypothetical protein
MSPCASSRNYRWGTKMGTLTATNSAGRTTAVALTGTSGGPLQFTPAPHNFGSLASGASSPLVDFNLRNNGASAVTGLTVVLAMSNSGDLSIAENGCAPTLNAGATCVVKVRFLAGAPGVKTATLTATGGFVAGGNPQTATATSVLTGTVTSAAAISITARVSSADWWSARPATSALSRSPTPRARLCRAA